MNNESVMDLFNIWIDMMRPITQHLIDENSEQWTATFSFCKSIENIEKAIAEKLQITAEEVKVMLMFKKKRKDLKERQQLKEENDMIIINNDAFKVPHPMPKLRMLKK